MIDARANITNDAPKGRGMLMSEPFPPSSREDLISTLPGFTPKTPSSRPLLETQECARPLARLEPTMVPDGEAEYEADIEWCVDVGGEITTMGTFALWGAIDRGEIGPSARIWREGMECWTALGEIPEIAAAFAAASSRTPEPLVTGELTPAPEPAPGGVVTAPAPCHDGAASGPEPLSPSGPEVGRSRIDTLISGPSLSGWGRLSHMFLPAPRRNRAPLWVGLGSAVAATAITAAVIQAEPARSALEPVAAAAVATAPDGPVETSPAALPTAERTDEAMAGSAKDAPEARPRHEQPGQRRLRRSGTRLW